VEETERKYLNIQSFQQVSDSLAGHLEGIKIPYSGLKMDYEGELGFMIGKAKDVDSDIKEYIFGYFIGNDISSRELQYRTTQYLLGKSLDGFYPNGPSVVTGDESKIPESVDQNISKRRSSSGFQHQQYDFLNREVSILHLALLHPLPWRHNLDRDPGWSRHGYEGQG